MNRFSEGKSKEFECGFLGEKKYEILFRNIRTPTSKLSFDLHHLILNKQSSYVGQRNMKFFNSRLELSDSSGANKITARITPYSQQNYEMILQHSKHYQKDLKAAVLFSIANTSESEIEESNRKDFSLAAIFKSQHLRNKLSFHSDESGEQFGVDYSFTFTNIDKKSKNSQTNKLQDSNDSVKSTDELAKNEQYLIGSDNLINNLQFPDIKEKSTSLSVPFITGQLQQDSVIPITTDKDIVIPAVFDKSKEERVEEKLSGFLAEFPVRFELSLNLKSIGFDRLQYSVFADVIFKKFEGVLSMNFSGKSLNGLMCMLRYNSSLWLRLTNNAAFVTDTTGHALQAGIELVYQHEFNKFIHLKNCINSNYTIATQLCYHPSDFVSLIYSANINIQKFKQDIEDYKVGYGIHFNF